MNQEEHISLKIQASQKMKKKDEYIQQCYEECCTDRGEALFKELIDSLDERYIPTIKKQLYMGGCYSSWNMEDVIQEARSAVWDEIAKSRKNGTIIRGFSFYCYGIYKKKAQDWVRKEFRQRNRFGDICSLDEPNADGNGKRGDLLIDQSILSPEDRKEADERRKAYDLIFKVYCSALVESEAEPPRELALYFARILPHLLHVNWNEETIPDTKAASAKWAYERMGQRTVGALGKDSEQEIRSYISPELSWSEAFYQQLEIKTDTPQGTLQLKDIIYTALYSKGKIEDWADSMHKTVIKKASQHILENSYLKEMSVEFISKQDKLFCLVKGGGKI